MKKPVPVFICLLLAVPCAARIITVDDNSPADYNTIQAAINAAENGDIVLVGRGLYNEHLKIDGNSITLASNYLNSNDEEDILQTIVYGAGTGAILEIRNVTPDTTVMGLTFKRGVGGIRTYAKVSLLYNHIINGLADGISYEGSGGICMFNVIENNRDDGIDCDGAVDVVIENNIICNNGDDGIEIRLHQYSGPLVTYVVRNNIISANKEDGIQLVDYPDLSSRVFYIENNIIAGTVMAAIGCMGDGNTSENYEGASIPEPVYVKNNTLFYNNYGITGGDNMLVLNNIFAATVETALKKVDGQSGIAYNAFWQNGLDFDGTSPGTGNISTDPCFVELGYWADTVWVEGDYHLKSAGWRWDSDANQWTWDDVTSRCIDAGNPGSPLGDELLVILLDLENERGQNLRIDIGAFGGTAEASMPPYDWVLLGDLTNDGLVNLADYAVQAVGWLISANQQAGDLNRDDLVDISDLALFVEDWLQQTIWR